MIMIVLSMMNNHVKYQRTLYLSLFVLSSFGYLRPVTCQPSFSPPSSHPKSCHNAARTLCEYIRIPIRVLSALTRLMFQMVDAVVVSLLPLLALLLLLLLLFNVGFHFHCLRSSFSVPPPLPVQCEVFSQSPHSNNNNNYAT